MTRSAPAAARDRFLSRVAGAAAVAVVAAAVLGVAAPAGTASPSAPVQLSERRSATGTAAGSRNGYVAWIQVPPNGGSKGNLWTQFRDGTRSRRLTSGNTASQPSWSHDGRHIAYGDGGIITIITQTGTLVRRLVRGDHPSWSRDDRTLVFSRGGSLFTVPTTGGTVRPVRAAPAGCTDSQPSWSPTAARILYQQDCSAVRRFYVLSLGNRAQTLVAATDLAPGGSIASPRWMPDGRRISLVATCRAPGRCTRHFANVMTAPATYDAPRTPVTTRAGSCTPASGECDDGYFQAAPSPDGSDFIVTYWEASGGQVYVMASLHARVARVYTDCCAQVPTAVDPDWGPEPPA